MRSDAKLLGAGVIAGERVALSKALSLAEQDGSDYQVLRKELTDHIVGRIVLGVTGPPGVGKSSLVNALLQEWRQDGRRVAVIAVDPSSPISGGALLGDRVRMSAALDDAGVYVRSLSSSGHVGGLAPAAVRLIDVFDAAGCDHILLETVGAGQSEIDIAAVADIKIVVSAPGLGDGIQAMKSGLLEIADVLVVNKSDQPGADATAEQLRNAVALRSPDGNEAPVILTSASRRDGIGVLIDQLSRIACCLSQEDALHRQHRRALYLIEQVAKDLLRNCCSNADLTAENKAIVTSLAAGEIEPRDAARRFLQQALEP